MTVCIVASCQIRPPKPLKGITIQRPVPGIVAISDRMLSTDHVSYEPEETKCFGFARSIWGWYAGYPAEAQPIVDAAKVRLPESPTVRDVAEAVAHAFREYRYQRALELHVIPFGYSPDKLPQRVRTQVGEHCLWTNFIIAGVDAGGSHIYTVDHPGQESSAGPYGYAAIGTGSPLVISYFQRMAFTKESPLPETLFHVYTAKRLAEKSPFVGKEFDLFVIKGGKQGAHTDELLKHLADSYSKVVDAEARARQEAVASLREMFDNPEGPYRFEY